MKIGSLLRHYQRVTEKSHQQLADEIGITRSDVIRIEAGKSTGAGKAAKIILWLFK